MDAFPLTLGAVGPQGPQGEPGPQGPAGSAGLRITRVDNINLSPNAAVRQFIVCNSGEIAIGGGFHLLGHDAPIFNAGLFAERFTLTSSGPGSDSRLWVVIGRNTSDRTVAGSMYAVCARQ